ncbi:MAG TPA: helix-turn-helix domain-containing protein [Polyangiaceae bacterium]|jgi:DNA-binding transcriptional regulator YiaG|nr:helix-turn-helix domain-containing protein [Polyangiaceae bacterium]
MARTPNLRLLPPAATDERRRAAETESRVRFIRARRAQGWTHAECAGWLGVSVDAVQLWERGKRRLPSWVLLLVEQERAA